MRLDPAKVSIGPATGQPGDPAVGGTILEVSCVREIVKEWASLLPSAPSRNPHHPWSPQACLVALAVSDGKAHTHRRSCQWRAPRRAPKWAKTAKRLHNQCCLEERTVFHHFYPATGFASDEDK
eukprot:scaffold627_cov125-Cylindrotheca_fusiformis.AAC.23